MKTFQQFREELLKEGYKFARTSKKPFGLRITAHKSGRFSDERALVYWHTRKELKVTDFTNFLRDFERFIKTNEDNYDIKAGFFLVGSVRAEVLKGLRAVLKTSSKDLREKVKVIPLKT